MPRNIRIPNITHSDFTAPPSAVNIGGNARINIHVPANIASPVINNMPGAPNWAGNNQHFEHKGPPLPHNHFQPPLHSNGLGIFGRHVNAGTTPSRANLKPINKKISFFGALAESLMANSNHSHEKAASLPQAQIAPLPPGDTLYFSVYADVMNMNWNDFVTKIIRSHIYLTGSTLSLHDISNIICNKSELQDKDIKFLVSKLKICEFNLNSMQFTNNYISDNGLESLMSILGKETKGPLFKDVGTAKLNPTIAFFSSATGKVGIIPHHLKILNLSNNNITDAGAKIIANSIANGTFYVKAIDLHNTNITTKGYEYLAKALASPKAKNAMLHLKSIFGRKEDKIAFLKHMLKTAKDAGIDTEHVIVNKKLFDIIMDEGKMIWTITVGWTKCKFVPDNLAFFASDQLIAKVAPKFMLKALDLTNTVTCYVEAWDKAFMSPSGVNIIQNELHLIGANDVIEALE